MGEVKPWKCRGVALAVAGLCALVTGGTVSAQAAETGEQVFKSVCFACHQTGVLDAPKAGDPAAWKERVKQGLDTLVRHARDGFGKMPPKGGNPNLSDADLRAAIRFMSGLDAARTAGGARAKKAAPSAASPAVAQADSVLGEKIVRQVCIGCHAIGVLGAPKIGNAADWEPRLKKGEDALVQHATQGIGNMPPKGGKPDLTAQDLRAAIRYMSTPAAPAPPNVLAAAPAPASAPTAPPVADKPPVPGPPDVNRFNRLLKPLAERNVPPMLDGIHDPSNEGTRLLQEPGQAFAGFVRGTGGNYVDWVKTLQNAAIAPRWDLTDPARQPLVMDLNIVREVKGSMPNVVYPHKAHLQWLDCSNCHPQIFIPKKGANQISMAEIILGGKCGVCHGKVAFPISECRRCHSQRKPDLASH